MRQRSTRANNQRLMSGFGSGQTFLEERVKAALDEVAPPPDMVERVMAAVASRQPSRSATRRGPLFGLAPAALSACIATLATLLFLMVADTCLAVGPDQAALAQRLSFATTMLRFRVAELANALLRLLGAVLP